MAEPIRNKRLNDLAAGAPTPQNTPASATNSYIDSHASLPSISTIQEEGTLDSYKAAVAAGLNNPALISMIEGRLGGLVGRSSGYIETLPAPVRSRVSGLKGIQKEYQELESEFRNEILELEKKYATKYKPLFEKRAKIIVGEIEPSEAEIEAGKEDEYEEEEEEKEEEDEEEDGDKEEQEFKSPIPADAKGIPEFWLTAIKNIPSLADTITDKDEEALKYLTDIRSDFIEQPGFKLYFDFAENEFFSNKTLTKTYYYQEETNPDGEYIYDHADGDEIEWKGDKNLTYKVEKKKQRNKHTKATRTVEKMIPTESFFNFFSPPIAPEDEDDEDIPEDLEERLQLDYQLGEEIKDKLIPRAVDWYTGEALDFDLDDFDPDDLDEFEEDDELDDDEDDDDDDDDDDGDAKPKQEAAECKQS
ncbi:uncharacterized protein V2V93DRAFT_320454 [Kockiozyma suomiensis]|uniref:uncharacterized protein n=1 Tax=Kockiozyma suomiensis TaxID=1337062 RepID=UPI0033437AF4